LGASAGLCLLADRYGYRIRTLEGTVELGYGAPVLEAELDVGLVPAALPDIRWRRGIDLAPVEVSDPDAVRWLEASLPPDPPSRRRVAMPPYSRRAMRSKRSRRPRQRPRPVRPSWSPRSAPQSTSRRPIAPGCRPRSPRSARGP